MLELVTREEAVAHLRIDGAADNDWLAILIPAISEAVAGWLKDSWRLYVPETDGDGVVVVDSSGDPVPLEDSNGYVVRPAVKAAVLIELSSQYRYREGEGENGTPTGDLYSGRYGYTLCRVSTSLLNSLRKTTIA